MKAICHSASLALAGLRVFAAARPAAATCWPARASTTRSAASRRAARGRQRLGWAVDGPATGNRINAGDETFSGRPARRPRAARAGNTRIERALDVFVRRPVRPGGPGRRRADERNWDDDVPGLLPTRHGGAVAAVLRRGLLEILQLRVEAGQRRSAAGPAARPRRSQPAAAEQPLRRGLGREQSAKRQRTGPVPDVGRGDRGDEFPGGQA